MMQNQEHIYDKQKERENEHGNDRRSKETHQMLQMFFYLCVFWCILWNISNFIDFILLLCLIFFYFYFTLSAKKTQRIKNAKKNLLVFGLFLGIEIIIEQDEQSVKYGSLLFCLV